VDFQTNSPDETFALGQRIAYSLIADNFIFANSPVLALRGTLGSGKTNLTKGIASGLGINETLTSPTYTIINEYRLPNQSILYHIDAYRLNSDKDFEDIGGPDIIHSGGISIIEWSERIPNSLPADVITISIEITGIYSRLITINGLIP
jgi:tRNA threonylcarbamoyladenosine biosynthesis protein TsaE